MDDTVPNFRVLSIHEAPITRPHTYLGLCVGGPLDGEEIASTEKTHRVSVPEGSVHEKTAGSYTRFYRQAIYTFEDGRWNYRG